MRVNTISISPRRNLQFRRPELCWLKCQNVKPSCGRFAKTDHVGRLKKCWSRQPFLCESSAFSAVIHHWVKNKLVPLEFWSMAFSYTVFSLVWRGLLVSWSRARVLQELSQTSEGGGDRAPDWTVASGWPLEYPVYSVTTTRSRSRVKLAEWDWSMQPLPM